MTEPASVSELTAHARAMVPILGAMGLEVLEVTPHSAAARLPAEPNVNHFGAMYAGCLFAVAEVLGGLMAGFMDVPGGLPLVIAAPVLGLIMNMEPLAIGAATRTLLVGALLGERLEVILGGVRRGETEGVGNLRPRWRRTEHFEGALDEIEDFLLTRRELEHDFLRLDR